MTSAELRKKLEEVQKARKKAEEREKAIKAKIKEAEIQEKQAKIEDLIKFRTLRWGTYPRLLARRLRMMTLQN